MLDALAKGAEVNVCTDGRHESPLMLAAGARSSRGSPVDVDIDEGCVGYIKVG